jgi:hypothetical protein
VTTAGFGTSSTLFMALRRYTNWTTNDSGFGAVSTYLTKKSPSYPGSNVFTLHTQTANTPLTQGTSTFVGDISPVEVVIPASTVANLFPLSEVFASGGASGDHPLIFNPNEGLRLFTGGTNGGSGTFEVFGVIHYFEASQW